MIQEFYAIFCVCQSPTNPTLFKVCFQKPVLSLPRNRLQFSKDCLKNCRYCLTYFPRNFTNLFLSVFTNRITNETEMSGYSWVGQLSIAATLGRAYGASADVKTEIQNRKQRGASNNFQNSEIIFVISKAVLVTMSTYTIKNKGSERSEHISAFLADH